MTKKEIVKTISDEMELTQLKTKEIVQRTFDAIVETLVTEGRIELRNFGVFEVKKRAARKARNPRTGDPVKVEEKFVVTFKPGKEMEERVRQLDSAETSPHKRSQESRANESKVIRSETAHPRPAPSESRQEELTDAVASSHEGFTRQTVVPEHATSHSG